MGWETCTSEGFGNPMVTPIVLGELQRSCSEGFLITQAWVICLFLSYFFFFRKELPEAMVPSVGSAPLVLSWACIHCSETSLSPPLRRLRMPSKVWTLRHSPGSGMGHGFWTRQHGDSQEWAGNARCCSLENSSCQNMVAKIFSWLSMLVLAFWDVCNMSFSGQPCPRTASMEDYWHLGNELDRRFSASLMPQPFRTVPHVVLTPNHKVIYIATL